MSNGISWEIVGYIVFVYVGLIVALYLVLWLVYLVRERLHEGKLNRLSGRNGEPRRRTRGTLR